MGKLELAKKLYTLAMVCESSYRVGCFGLPDGMTVLGSIVAGSDIAYVIESERPECLGIGIVFRGSDDVSDWASNLAISLVGYPDRHTLFHQGFLDAYLRLSSANNGFLRVTRVFDWVCGHSRGGALSVIHAILRNFEGEVVTFGSPRCVGGMAPEGLNHIRVVNRDDIVPSVPGRKAGYFHWPSHAINACDLEPALHATDDCDGSVSDHDILEYVMSLASVVGGCGE